MTENKFYFIQASDYTKFASVTKNIDKIINSTNTGIEITEAFACGLSEVEFDYFTDIPNIEITISSNRVFKFLASEMIKLLNRDIKG